MELCLLAYSIWLQCGDISFTSRKAIKLRQWALDFYCISVSVYQPNYKRLSKLKRYPGLHVLLREASQVCPIACQARVI